MPDVNEVPRQAAGDNEQRVDAYVVSIAGIARREALGGDCDPAQAIFVERPGGRFFAAALFHLDERENAAAPGYEIDLAARDAGAAGENSPAVETQPPGRERFRPPTARFGDLPVQLLPASSSARA